jgi:hypothetical protein
VTCARFLDSERESEDPRLRFFGVVRALTSRRQCAWLPWGVLGGLTGISVAIEGSFRIPRHLPRISHD